MKKSIKYVVTCMTMVLAFFVTDLKAQAADSLKDSLEASEQLLQNRLGEGEAVYSGGPISNLQQTNATTTAATITWNPAAGATSYLIVESDGTSAWELTTVTDTTYTRQYPAEDSISVLGVYPIDANGAKGTPETVLVSTVPTKIKTIVYADYFADNNHLRVAWSQNLVADGYEVVCYNSKGKAVQKLDVPYSSYSTDGSTFTKTNTRNVYYVVVKAYIYINNNTKKLYGAVSNKFYAVPQPKVTSKNSDVKEHSINLKWKKVKGATSYTIYVSTQRSSGYKKAATVKTNSYKLTKHKGKTINTGKSTYYIKIVTNAKFKSKKVKSRDDYIIRAYTTYY